MRTDADLSAVRWHAGAFNNGLIFGLTYHLVTRLPRWGSYAIGHAVTWLAYQLMRDGTRAIVGNLRVVRPDATEPELKRLALFTYRSYARDTVDFIRSLAMKRTEDAVREATQVFATQLEDRIRANPQLWYQFYPYWRTPDTAQHT